ILQHFSGFVSLAQCHQGSRMKQHAGFRKALFRICREPLKSRQGLLWPMQLDVDVTSSHEASGMTGIKLEKGFVKDQAILQLAVLKQQMSDELQEFRIFRR